MTCEFIYKTDSASWNKAKDLLSKLVGSDRAKAITSLKKREDFLKDKPVTDEQIKGLLLDGSRNTRRNTTSRNARSRSPTNKRESRTSPKRRSPRRKPQSENTDARPPTGRGRGRGGQNRSRSSSRSRVLQFSRDNYNGKARSPRNSPNARSYNSLWNENAQAKPQNRGKSLKLNTEEEAIIKALRNSKND